jgi:DNA-directed RNA polymerase sigma subunit (sigma70/sigma32)
MEARAWIHTHSKLNLLRKKDLVSEGYLGLVKDLGKFSPSNPGPIII